MTQINCENAWQNLVYPGVICLDLKLYKLSLKKSLSE